MIGVSNVRISWLFGGFDELRQDKALVRHINELAQDLAESSGNGFEWKAEVRKGNNGSSRYRAIVYTDTPRAMVVNARDNTLLKLLGGG